MACTVRRSFQWRMTREMNEMMPARPEPGSCKRMGCCFHVRIPMAKTVVFAQPWVHCTRYRIMNCRWVNLIDKSNEYIS